jgi:outer membrane protein
MTMENTRMRKTSFFVAAALAAFAAGAAAQSHSVRIGGTYIDVHSKADPLSGAPVPDARLEVGDASTLTFSYVYKPDDTWAVQLALGIPPKYKAYGRGFLEPFGQIASVKEIAPTLFVDYRFAALAGKWRPYVGAGINYTHFTGLHSTASGNAAGGGPTTLELKDSWGPAVHAGVEYLVDKHWSVVGTISAAKVKSDLTATAITSSGPAVATTTIDFRPVTYTLAVAYTF